MPNADQVIQYSNGGQFNTAVAGANAETLVYTGAGRVCQVAIVTLGTVGFSLYDGTQSTGGTLIYSSVTNPTLGAVTALDWPFANGLVVKGSSTATHGIAVAYNKAGVNGN